MTDLSKLLGELSPEQWKLLQLRLKKKQSAQGEPGKAGRIPRRDPGRQELPLSFSQQRLWFLDQWEPGNPAYNMFAAFRLEGTLDPAALARAIEEIVRRHESLRTTFTSEAGRPRQVVSAPGPVPLPLVDLSGLPSGQAAEVRGLGAAHAGRSFDLERGPLLRITLVRLAPAEHWVLLAIHHIVSDGWSMGVFNRELATLYTGFLQGAPPQSLLPPLAIQYPDYALWQREWLAGETLEGQLAFWRELLTGAPPLLDLPLDHPRGALPGAPAGSLTLRVPKEASDRLQALAVAEGGTLYMVLLAGFAALLSRYTGSDDVVVGAPVANRNRSDIEGLIGFFVNTLAMRVSAAGDPTGRELLRRARKVTSGAYDHQDVPFELLVDQIQPERDLSHPPLVQVTLGLQNLPPQSVELPGLRLSVVPIESPGAKFDMVWALAETPEGINGGIEFNLSLFEPATAARMAGHFVNLLQVLAASPDARLSELPLLSDFERHQLIVAWNDTTTTFPRERTVVELFEEQVAAAPGATAVAFKDQSLTYGELDLRAGRLARRLCRLGVGPEVPVGLCADRSLDLIVGLLAIVKAGGAFVPLDPAYPSERLGYMLESSGAPLVLAQAGTVSSLPADVQARVLLLEEIQDEDPGEDAPALRPLPENLLYIIYTSGSTGRPKGVAVSHRSAIRLVRDVDYARLDARETFLQIVPLSFDPSMFEIWGALLNGARLVLFPARVPTLEEIEETVRDQGVTTLWLTTGLFHQVVDHKIEALYPLRQLLAGGEALSLPHVRKVLEHLPGVRMVNGYGPTEVTCFTTTWTAEPLPAYATGVPIGKPMSNTRTLVLGRGDCQLGQLVPVGVWGELYAGGEGVARGYFGRPDLTAERFVPDPFPPEGEPGARLYRTGDRARLLADGTIEFAGRFDSQVKVRGFRIELGEIETALAHLPGVLESTVLVREDSPGVRRITAYVVPKDGVTLDPEILREALGETLPEYMVPTAWVVLDALPLTPNGKIDRRALPAPEAERASAGYVAPRNETEALLAGIWADVLGVERIGVEDDFFDLGGNSLLSLQVAARAGQAGLSFHVREMFEHSTVASLARALGVSPADAAPVEPTIEPVPRDRPLPLSFAQQRLWFLDRLEPGSPIYNIFTGLRLMGRLDVSALQRAVTEVVCRHEAVRSVFAAQDGEPVQIVMPPPESFPISVIDLSSSPSLARQLVVEEAARPFDLANGPLLRAALVRLAPEEHLALLTMHHIASDGWSMGLLVREITTLYTAFLEGRPSPLPELHIQYADFAAWQRGWLAGEVLDGEIAFWRERLAGAPPVLELPADRPRPSTQRHQGAAETRLLPASLLANLDALSRGESASLFMTTLAAAQTLLFRITGQDDVVVGSPVANRNRVEIEPLIGFFVNTLVLRTVLDGDPGFREAIGRVREGALSAYAHQEVPFERLVEELRPERSLSHTPIFQVMVLLQNASRDRFSLPGLEAEGLAGEQTTAKFDLLLAFAETPQGLIASLEYDTDLFFPATARRLLGQLETLLTAAVREPDRRIGDLPLLSAPERQQLLVEWNDGAVSWPVEGCLHELIERQVERTPAAVAVTFEERSLTYAELNGLANRWAWVLRDLGVGPDTLVGVCLERSIEMVVALVSVIKAGGAYVPIDPSYPKDRLTYMLEDSRVPVLLTQERLLPTLPLPEGDGPRAICLDTSEPPFREGRPDSGTGAKSAAYAIYTSGSTGKPKGAVNTHESIVNRLLWMQSAYGLGPGDHVLQKTPFSFDVSVWEFFWPLMMGARLVVAKPGGHQDPAYLARLIQDEGITTLHFVPSMLQVFLEEPAVSGCTSLRRVMASGEALPVELEERFFERMPAPAVIELHNLYGPTEAAVDVTYEPCVPNRGASSVPIGRPVANTRIHLLDRSMRLVPMGVAGELHIGGIQLARGYLRRPELTAERFVPDPCSEEPGSRLYKTGDLARHLPDGHVEYLGRLDFQVKIRGFRIELGEIEAALNRHPAVRESIVIAREDRGGKRLVAYVVAAKGEELSVAALRESLGAGLPEHMVPSVFVVLEALPLSPNGKVERKALPAPDEAGGSGEWIAPRTPTEELLAAVWAEILGRERVGSTDNFFELGGHSLLATQVVSRVRKVFGVELPLRALFARPTLAALAREIETGAAGEASLPPIVPVPWEGGRPLSFAQQRLWFLDRLEPGNAVYNLPLAFRLIGRLEAPALAAAVSGVVRRHEALRTRFEVVAGEPVQVVDPPAPMAVPVIDLSGIEGREEAERLARIDAARPFDLARGPLLRVTLVRLAEEDHLVLATMHHIVSDGWSMGVFIREVAALYVAASDGRPSPLPELPVQYSDFALWQRRHLSGEALDRQLAYWRERLAGAPAALELPTDRPRPVVRRQLGAQRPWSTSAELLERLEALARSRGVTLFMVLLAAFQTLLRRLGGQADCLVGSPIANRNRAEIEGLIGFFVNALVLRGDLSGSPTFTELLERTREVALGAYAHQDLPFEKLVEELQPERSLSHTPLFQVVLGLQNAPVSAMELPDLRLEPVNPETGTAKFDLTVLLGAGPNGIAGSFEYDLDLFDPATVQAIADRYTVLLEGVAENPDRRLSDLPLLTAAERHQLVIDWNDTATAFPGDRTIDTLFEEQVAKTPHSTAVVFRNQSLTYAELNAEADRLARRLRHLGVGPEVPVGLCADRSLGLMVGLLAIIKAGGAFVPLDPAYPSERLGYMLESSGAPLVLAQNGTLSALPETKARVLIIEELRGEESDVRDTSVVRPLPDNLLYIMYTSGSTGRPKGVAITHRSAIRLVKETNYARFDADETFLQLVPLSFDPSMFEIWGALLYGAKLVLFPARVPLPEDLEETIRTQGVTTLWLTTGLFHQVIDHKVEALAPLRQLLAGGEALSLPHVNKVVETFPEIRLVNGYGPTEVTCFTTCWQAHPLRPDAPCVPIGKPISNTRVLVLDADGQPVPRGVSGELYAGGVAVARCYFGRPDLTAERFVPDPCPPAGEEGARLYRTGDRVRFLPDGTLEFFGRFDNQVKVRGFRIELGEIETALSRHPGVQEATVLVREDSPGHRRIVAYVVAREGAALDMATLKSFAGGALPEYMVPGAWVFLDSLPLTPNGKVDRRALPAPGDEAVGATGEDYAAPRTPVEEILVGLWTEVLGAERVGVHDDFFERGGHSLLATRLISGVRTALGVDLPMRKLFEAPTVAEFGLEVEEARRADLGPGVPPIEPRTDPGQDLPLSFAQERLWFLDQLESDPAAHAAYNLSVPVRLLGDLDTGALRLALGELVRRHESLRTTFPSISGRPVQRIGKPFDVPFSEIDLSGRPESELRKRLEEETTRPFDLATGPLVRAALLRVADEEHVFALTQHHIVTDGWSMGVLIRELAAIYGAYASGKPSPLPDPALQYADFSVWQRRWLQGEALDRQLDFWKNQLSGELPVLELPTSRPRPAVQTFRGESEFRLLPSELSEGVLRLGRREGATLFMTLLAAFGALLHRLSGQDDILVGTPIAGRNRAEVEGMLGFFVNTLVLRSDLSGNPAFRELLARVRETAFGAYAHQDLPFEKLVAEVQPDRDLSRTPLFQVFFNVLNFTRERFEMPKLAMEGIEAPPPPSKFDLTLYVSERPEGIGLLLLYNADLFDAERMAGFLAQLEGMLAAFVAEPETPIDEVSLVTEAARAVLPDPAAPLVEQPGLVPVHELFARRAASAPRRIAVRDAEEIWTYGQLDAQANRLARRLLAAGLQKGEVVAIDARRSAMLPLSVLGVLKAGGAFLILDPAYPASRRAAYLRLAQPQVLIGMAPLPEECEAELASCHRVDLADLDEGDASAPAAAVGPNDLAYVAFTSGSTGTPKGILGEHAPLSHFLGWHAETFGFGPDDRFSLLSGLAHDPLLRDLFTPLTVGATLCIPSGGIYEDPRSLVDWLAAERVSVMHLTPALAQMLTHGATAETALPDLRRAFFGGDRLTGRDIAGLQALAPNVACFNFYGATETPQAMGWHAVTAEETEAGDQVLPVGLGIDGVQLLVLNRRDLLTGFAELGEIAVRTPYLSRGYLGDEALTLQRFPANPATGDPKDRVYRTGDLGRYREDGQVEFAGRADAQVKIRGFRIELAEVEAAVSRHPHVTAVAVLAVEEEGERRLVAYVVPRQESLASPALRAFLADRLPAYMVPSAFVFLDRLPLTPNGKLDRRALARLAAPRETLAEVGRVLPRTPIEEMLAELWTDLLKIEGLSVHDSFFDLGGHSLLATQMVSRVREAFGVELPLRRLFETPTVAGLAAAVEAARLGDQRPVAPPIVPRTSTSESPLSFSQERLWILDQLEPGNASYNMPVALRLQGLLDVNALAASFTEIVRRHEVLRTVFASHDGRPVQVIREPAPFDLHVVDVESEPTARRLAATEASRPFDLAQGPLLRASLLRLAPDDHLLIANMHHIVSDGWSMGIFVAEIAALYGAYVAGRPSPLPDLQVQYADFAEWQRSWLSGEVLERQMRYWRERLAGAPALLELPTDRPRPPVQTFNGLRRSFVLPPELSEALMALTRRTGTTPFMLLLAAFEVLLHRYTGADDIVVGTPIANRTRKEIEPLIGFFVNTLVLRNELGDEPAFADLLARVREGALGAFAHQDLPFERLVEELRPERHLAYSPLFQVMFTLQNAPMASLDLPGLTLSPVESANRASRFDWTLSFSATPGGMGGYLEYNTDLFDGATIGRALQSLETLLAAVAADPGARVSELPLLPEAERWQVLEAWNDTPAPAWESPVHELFAAQAARTPDATALVCRGEALSYSELDRRSSRVAGLLASLGAGPDVPVALAMERSLEMVVGLLGIWKAGAAYLPLDPAYPEDRLAFMLEDSEAPILVTHGALPDRAWSGKVVRLSPGGDVEETSGVPTGSGPDHLAYILYTSGSTGRPKGVQVTHRALANFLGAMRREPGLDPEDVMVAVTSLSFDIAGLELWLPLLIGARVVLAAREEAADGLLLRDLVETSGGTVLQGTPATWRLLIAAGWQGGSTFKALCGGEAFPPALASALRERAGSVWNLYGPTETTVWSSVAAVEQVAEGAPVSIGRPIDATEIYLVDPNGEPVPVGVPGELRIGGVGLARGYLGRPDLTAERFVPNPFGDGGRDRLYRTGDLARWRPDGTLECLGRIDHQVKLRGFRIELGEIEAALARHPAVAQAAAAIRGEEERSQIVAYVVARPDAGPIDATEIRVAVRRSLPDYMVPTTVMELDALPLTPNGKVDRKALPEPERARTAAKEYVAPSTPVEEILAGIWAGVLGMGEESRVGAHDNFFDLGGHSVLAIQIVARARQAGLDLTPMQIFQHPTVAGLAAVASVSEGAMPAAELAPVAEEGTVDLAAANLNDDDLALFLAGLGGGPPSE